MTDFVVLGQRGLVDNAIIKSSCQAFSSVVNNTLLSIQPENLKLDNVDSRHYRYQPNPLNALLFQSLDLRIKEAKVRIANRARFYMRAKVWPFLKFNFDPESIQSEIKLKMKFGDIQVYNVEFFLNVMWMKINMQLTSSIIFYPDAVYIPMVFTFPKNYKKWIREDSGILYVWEQLKGLKQEKLSEIPDFHTEFSKYKKGEFPKTIQNSCFNNSHKTCLFSKSMTIEETPLNIRFQIKKEDVKDGLFPWRVNNISKLEGSLAWDHQASKHYPTSIKRKTSYTPMAMYFDATKFRKERYQFGLWIDSSASSDCPRTVPSSQGRRIELLMK